MSSSEDSRPPSEMSRPPLDDQRSLSDGDFDGDKKRKRARRKRGNRGRYKPYDTLGHATTSADVASLSDTSPKKKSRCKVMAPRNTTQFLLDDIEARAEMEREVEHAHSAEGRQRIRSLSVSSDLLPYSDESDTSVSEAEHREFETELEEYNIDRISKLTRDQMAREILDKDKEAEVYHDNLVRVNRENERLKRLLKDNGIPLDPPAKPGIQPQAVS